MKQKNEKLYIPISNIYYTHKHTLMSVANRFYIINNKIQYSFIEGQFQTFDKSLTEEQYMEYDKMKSKQLIRKVKFFKNIRLGQIITYKEENNNIPSRGKVTSIDLPYVIVTDIQGDEVYVTVNSLIV